jgi:hypothetical protein
MSRGVPMSPRSCSTTTDIGDIGATSAYQYESTQIPTHRGLVSLGPCHPHLDRSLGGVCVSEKAVVVCLNIGRHGERARRILAKGGALAVFAPDVAGGRMIVVGREAVLEDGIAPPCLSGGQEDGRTGHRIVDDVLASEGCSGKHCLMLRLRLDVRGNAIGRSTHARASNVVRWTGGRPPSSWAGCMPLQESVAVCLHVRDHSLCLSPIAWRFPRLGLHRPFSVFDAPV